MHIHGRRLPSCIEVLLQAERWIAPDSETLQRVMGDVPDHPIFYHYSLMHSENSHWLEEKGLEYGFSATDLRVGLRSRRTRRVFFVALVWGDHALAPELSTVSSP